MWRLTGTTACWESARFQARIDLADPRPGIIGLTWHRHALTDVALMQMHPQPNNIGGSVHLEDCYVRGTDLIARYADASRQTVFPEFYWRIWDDAPVSGAVVIESWLSVHTQWLDSDPEVIVQCEMPADGYQVWRLPSDAEFGLRVAVGGGRTPIEITPSGCAVIWQSTVHPLVFGQVVHPADVSSADVMCDAASQLITSRVAYFRGSLEKGVIRRARLRGVLTESDRASSVLTQHWHALLSAPPPLAT